MSKAIITEALRVSQEFGLKVFPCGANKKPLCLWKDDATSDPAEIERLFGRGGAALVGVPCGEANDLFVIDLDTYKASEGDAVLDFEDEVRAAGTRLHRTKSGGLHAIFLNPAGRQWHRQPMAHCEMIGDGYYFIWPTEGSGYVVEDDIALDLLDEPSDDLLRQRERLTGATTGALMTAAEADACMRSNGSTASRHEALLRLTHDFVQAVPAENLNMGWLTVAFTALFEDDYAGLVDADRMDELLEARQDQHGEWHGELVRALAYPMRTRQAERGTERMVELLKASGETPLIEETKAVSGDEFERVVLEELYDTELPDIDFIVEDMLPSRNLIGVAGPSGAGKTRFISALVAALSAGRTDLIGLPRANRPVKTMYCANEERGEDIKRRLKAAGKLNGIPGDLDLLVRGKDRGTLKLADVDGVRKDTVKTLCKIINKEQVELIIFDPFVTLGADDENAAAGVGHVIEAMHSINSMSCAAVMFIHHTPKGLADEELRGSSAAFRGSGAIYSSLDVAFTLFPFLPPEAYSGRGAKDVRMQIRLAQANKQLSKFIVLDPAKEREGDPVSPVHYRLSGQEVRRGGKKIGAIEVVPEREALDDMRAVTEGSRAIAAAGASVVAREILTLYPGKGDTVIALKDVVYHLNKAKIDAWKEDRGQARADRGPGKKLLEMFSEPVPVDGLTVRMSLAGKAVTWHCH